MRNLGEQNFRHRPFLQGSLSALSLCPERSTDLCAVSGSPQQSFLKLVKKKNPRKAA